MGSGYKIDARFARAAVLCHSLASRSPLPSPLAPHALMTDDTFPMAGLKAGLTLLVLAVLFAFLIWDARRNRPE